ncbi:hypothetical protein [Streptomyces sp. 4N124]|uniref:hypothetical protein n=1 Tax=Streptomyces sp. 4N124 TaxID=3457420 RepID=UPI003FD55A10
MQISKMWKAVAAALAAGAASLSTAMNDSTVTGPEGVTAALAVLGITWAVPNREPKDQA